MKKLSSDERHRLYENAVNDIHVMREYVELDPDRFVDYVHDHFKEEVERFKEGLYPTIIVDEDSFPWDQFEEHLFKKLGEERLNVLIEAYCESNWRRFSDWVADGVDNNEGPDEDRDR